MKELEDQRIAKDNQVLRYITRVIRGEEMDIEVLQNCKNDILE